MATKTLSELVAEGFRKVAMDQIAQDITNAQTFVSRAEMERGDVSRLPVAIEQIINLYNGYSGTSLDYRDYLDTTATQAEDALYALCNAYNGTSAS